MIARKKYRVSFFEPNNNNRIIFANVIVKHKINTNYECSSRGNSSKALTQATIKVYGKNTRFKPSVSREKTGDVIKRTGIKNKTIQTHVFIDVEFMPTEKQRKPF